MANLVFCCVENLWGYPGKETTLTRGCRPKKLPQVSQMRANLGHLRRLPGLRLIEFGGELAHPSFNLIPCLRYPAARNGWCR